MIISARDKKVPSHADHLYDIGEQLLLFSENQCKWIGPFVLSELQGRMAPATTEFLSHNYLTFKLQMKPYYAEMNFQYCNELQR